MVDRPEWFRSIDLNSDESVQIKEFDKGLGETPGVLQLIKILKKQNGLLKIDLGN